MSLASTCLSQEFKLGSNILEFFILIIAVIENVLCAKHVIFGVTDPKVKVI